MRLIRDHVSTAVFPKIADTGPLPELTSSPRPNPSDLAVRAASSYGIKRTSVTIFAPESSYTGRIFKLSQDYPQRKPPLDAAIRKILAIDFNKDWKAYA